MLQACPQAPPHNLITGNLVRELGNLLRQRPGEVYPSDMRVRVQQSGLYTYPDVTVVCEPPQFADDHRDILLNPSALFDVLSDSTEAYDRGHKFEQYRTLDSLTNYVLIAQHRPLVETYQRQSDGSWNLRAHGPGGKLLLAQLDIALAVDEIYFKVFSTNV